MAKKKNLRTNRQTQGTTQTEQHKSNKKRWVISGIVKYDKEFCKKEESQYIRKKRPQKFGSKLKIK